MNMIAQTLADYKKKLAMKLIVERFKDNSTHENHYHLTVIGASV